MLNFPSSPSAGQAFFSDDAQYRYENGQWVKRSLTKAKAITTNLNLTEGELFFRTVSAPITLTVSNPPPAGLLGSFVLELTNGGAAAVTWFAGVTWAGGTPPTLTAAGVDVIGFYTRDGGVTYRGVVLAQDSKAPA